jgi:hypothetical protein
VALVEPDRYSADMSGTLSGVGDQDVRPARGHGKVLHHTNVASDLIAATAALTEAVAAGEVTPGEAASLSMLVGNVAKAVETFELSTRLAKLEEPLAAKGGNP